MNNPPTVVAFTARIALLILIFAGASAAGTAVARGVSVSPLKKSSLSDLRVRLRQIESQLAALSQPNMRSGMGAIGYRSRSHDHSEQTEWVQIDLERKVTIEQVVLVPTIWRDAESGFRADGFPLRFRILVGDSRDADGREVASFDASDQLLPRVAPVVVDIDAVACSWVRVEAVELTPRAWDGKFLLQFSEIFVFHGMQNVALRRPVEVSTSEQWETDSRDKRFLVDGFVPYLMDAPEGVSSVAFLGTVDPDDSATVTIDLGSTATLDGIHLHAIDINDSVPQAAPEGFGIPRRMSITGANRADFSDAKSLLDFRCSSVYDVGPIIMRRFSETPARYVRLGILEPYPYVTGGRSRPRIGFAEIEVLSRGRNLAVDKQVDLNFRGINSKRASSALTDGHNLFGRILPIRSWLSELALRHELEADRPAVAAELALRYQWQRTNLVRLGWVVALLAVAVIGILVAERIARQRAILRTRERIGADLHDELGANLHAIGLLGDVAQANLDSPEKLTGLLQRMRALTKRSGNAARQCVNLLESKDLYGDLIEDMEHTSARMMADLQHEIRFEGEEALRQLRAKHRLDIFLFYKECLTNILRHSDATRVSTSLVAEASWVVLTITDNGCGLSQNVDNRVPLSLSRRARLLGARVSARDHVEGGTQIILRLRTRRFGISF